MYFIEKLTPEKALVREWHAFLSNHYHEDLVDPWRIIRQELMDTRAGGYETPHAGIILRDPISREIFAGASGNLLPLKGYRNEDQTGKRRKVAVNFLAYSAPEFGGEDNHVDVAIDGLAAELHGHAKRMERLLPVTFAEAEQEKKGIYGEWGFYEPEGVIYTQPNLKWSKKGKPESEAVKLELVVKESGDIARKSGIISANNELSGKFLRAFGKYLFQEWYFPEVKAKYEDKVWKVLKGYQKEFLKSIKGREWIPLKEAA